MIRKDFECATHGLFEADVAMDDETAPCPVDDECYGCGGQPNAPGARVCGVCNGAAHPCGQPSPWAPAPVRGKVRAVEAVRGGWTRPERSTFLDTRDLGEGQDIDDWRARRAELRHKQRQREAKETF